MSDNKQYRGKIDRIRVAFGQDQHYEVDYFVKAYLENRGYAVNKENREALHAHLEQYPHSGTVMRDELTTWLNQRIAKA